MGIGYGYSLCKSDCAPILLRPFPKKIARERLDGAIRLLRGETAGYSFLCCGSKPYHIGDGTIRFCFPSLLSAILPTHSRLAVIPTIDHSKPSRSRRHEQPLPPIMKNERPKPNNPTETRTIQSRTQIAKQYSELASNDSTGYRIPKSLSTAAAKMPRRSGFPRGEEVESRGWRRGAPQSPSSSSFGAPQGNNEIYTYDVVFSPGEARKKIHSQPQLPYNAPAGPPHW